MKKLKKLVLVSILIVIFLIAAMGSFLVLKAIFGGNASDDPISKEESTEESTNAIDDKEPEENETKIVEINFQPVIDKWVKTVDGNKSILIYDLNLNKIVGSYNVEEDYGTASLYKLFVVYEGYKRVESGKWNGEAKAGSTGYTINKCLDLAIRESYSPCAETLWSMIGHDALDKIMETEWDIINSDISKLVSNVSDINKIMKRFYEHPDFNDSTLLENMWDSFLNQPKTTYDWRQGLPSGFDNASVYNKVGWEYNPSKKYWNIYHDTAIVKFPLVDGTTRDFIVTVMTNKVDHKYIKNFGTMLEKYFEESL